MPAPSRFVPRFAALAVAASLLTGCTTYHFKVDAVKAAPDTTAGVSYQLQSAHPEVTGDHAVFRRVADHVKTALSSKGLFEAPAGVTPDMDIEIDFGIANERTEQRVIDLASPIQSGGFHGHGVSNHAGPSDGIVVLVTFYEKFVRITAHERTPHAGAHTPREVWSVYVSTENEDADLDKYLPLLVSAAMDAIDSDTNGPRKISFGPNDERVAFVNAGM